jgi:protein involved in polysaccharide export with SLBB domain
MQKYFKPIKSGRAYTLSPNKLIDDHSLPFRFLCLLMAGLTACSTTRSQYVWHDATSQQSSLSRAPQPLESWGQKLDTSNISDPDIAPGFLLTLRSLSDAKLNGDFRVDYDGNVQLPYDVTINTANTTLAMLKRKLVELYHPYFKNAPDIDVRVKERRYWVDVRGLVEKPGRYLVEPEASLDLVIGMAGGTSKDNPPVYVRIQKGQKVVVFDLDRYYGRGEDRPQILGWYGGEILFFQKDIAGLLGAPTSTANYRLPIYMLGEVKKPGEYTLTPGSDFVDSLVQAGGFTDRADLDNIELIRRIGGVKRVYDFSWNEFQRAPAPLQGDVIMVHADNITKSERHITLFATIIAALASVATATILILAYNRNPQAL